MLPTRAPVQPWATAPPSHSALIFQRRGRKHGVWKLSLSSSQYNQEFRTHTCEMTDNNSKTACKQRVCVKTKPRDRKFNGIQHKSGLLSGSAGDSGQSFNFQWRAVNYQWISVYAFSKWFCQRSLQGTWHLAGQYASLRPVEGGQQCLYSCRFHGPALNSNRTVPPHPLPFLTPWSLP